MSIFGSSHFGLPRLKPLNSKRSHIVSVLDIGSTKVVCMIGRLTPRPESEILPGRTHSIEIIGLGHQRSRGVKNGGVVDLDAAESVVRLAVDAAERMAGLTIDSLIVNVSAGRLQSDIYTGTIQLKNSPNEWPAWTAISGTRDVGVMPGCVLISSHTISPFSEKRSSYRKSDLLTPRHPIA